MPADDIVQPAERGGDAGATADFHARRGGVLLGKGRYVEAAEAFERAYLLGRYPDALLGAVHASLRGGRWQALAAAVDALRKAVADPSIQLNQFALLSVPKLSRAELLAGANAYAHSRCVRVARMAPASPFAWTVGAPLRIGYLSADFRSHATATLIAGVLEAHDRRRVEIFGYSYGPDDGSPIGARVRAAFDVLRDIGPLDLAAAARRIRADRIDILVDLMGWTAGSRTGLLAWRPAPVQVSWLGYPGTLGARQLADYLIGDAWVTPLAHADGFAETLALLPHSYQPNDARRSRPPPATRAAAGLPDGRFVYCCFNQTWKINPAVADLWAQVLRATPGSMLWLLDHGEEPRGNLRREFAARGVEATRLVFAPFLSWPAHAARLQLADVALDTFPYGSHTTASDALWMGVPLVTLPGATFASRVGASLVAAAGLPELIAPDAQAFVALAVGLWRERDRLARLRSHLAEGGARLPLFDSARFTRNLERLYFEMWRRRMAGDESAIVLAE